MTINSRKCVGPLSKTSSLLSLLTVIITLLNIQKSNEMILASKTLL